MNTTIYSQKDFAAILERERVRADRTGGEFSIVIFEVALTKDFDSLIQYLSYIIGQRVRCYDELGWINAQRIGAILPDTPPEGAHKLAEDVCSAIIPKALRPRFTILTYPSNWINDLEGPGSAKQDDTTSRNSQGNSREDKTSRLEAISPLLPKGLPFWKRLIDIVSGVFILTLISPILLLVAMFIKTVSPGPVFFKQGRMGHLGRTFTCWKFRTMHLDAAVSMHQDHVRDLINNENPMHKLDDQDPRIIPLGKIMRKTGLDELPQLINVIRGEMSLIGPRPCIPYEAQQYHLWQHKRFDAVPGLTGLWQVSGKNKTTFNDMVRFDIKYTKKRSLWLDLKILLKTPPAIIDQVNH